MLKLQRREFNYSLINYSKNVFEKYGIFAFFFSHHFQRNRFSFGIVFRIFSILSLEEERILCTSRSIDSSTQQYLQMLPEQPRKILIFWFRRNFPCYAWLTSLNRNV